MARGTPLITRWYDGFSPRARDVQLRIDGERLLVEPREPDRPTLAYPIARVRWPERRTHGQRQTDLPDGSLIQHTDAGEWDAWWARQGFVDSFVVGWQQSWRAVLVAVLVTLVLLGVLWAWGVPWASARIAAQLPAPLEQRIGQESRARLESLFLQPSQLGADEQQALRERWRAMVRRAHPEGDAPAHGLFFHASPALGPNAFALPAGQIVVTDELVQLLHDRPEVLMGVIAHELGHVQHRDGLDMLVRATFISAVVGVVFGDMGSFVAAVPAALLSQSYSRDAERRADRYAAELLHANGVPPAIMATLFERLRAQRPAGGGADRLPIAIASHPADEERVRFFEAWEPEPR